MRRDRVILKGFGLHFEGEGRPALTLAYCGTGLLLVVILLLCIGTPAITRGLIAIAYGL
jgi:hypothetical protein